MSRSQPRLSRATRQVITHGHWPETFVCYKRFCTLVLQDANTNYGFLLGTQTVFKRYVEKLTAESRADPPCPVCHRPFDSADEITELVSEVSAS